MPNNKHNHLYIVYSLEESCIPRSVFWTASSISLSQLLMSANELNVAGSGNGQEPPGAVPANANIGARCEPKGAHRDGCGTGGTMAVAGGACVQETAVAVWGVAAVSPPRFCLWSVRARHVSWARSLGQVRGQGADTDPPTHSR